MNENQRRKLRKFLYHPLTFVRDGIYKHFLSRGHDDYEQIFEQLTRFSLHYDVDSMKVGSEYVWPYLRNHLWAGLNSIVLGNVKDKNLKPYRIQGGHPSQISLRDQKRLKQRFNAKALEDFEGHPAVDYLFFVMQNATEKQILDNGTVYHKIMDPLYEVASQMGSALKIEIVRTNNLEQNWANYKYPATLLLLDCQNKHFSDSLVYDSSFHHKMKEYIPSLNGLNRMQLGTLVDYELSIRDYYVAVLKRLNPKIIFLNFYHRYAPLCSAAHELGIWVVDVQHGLQKGWNPLYNHYEEAKNKGYQALPRTFAVWTEKDSSHIESTFGADWHSAVVIGNPWLKRSLELSTPAVSEDRKVRGLALNKHRVLVILQKKQRIPKFIQDVISSSLGNNIQWIIRHHPKGERFRSTHFAKGADVLISDDIDQMPIGELCRYADVTFSEGSALSLEMAQLGILGVVFGSEGYKNYHDEIMDGQLHFVASEEAFFAKVQKEMSQPITKSRSPNVDPLSGPNEQLWSAMRQICRLAETNR